MNNILNCGKRGLVPVAKNSAKAICAVLCLLASAAGAATATFTTAGTTSWTAPAGVFSATVEAWGGGGAGGGAVTNPGQGGGGAGGQYAIKVVTVVPGTVYTVVVGAGGTGATGDGPAGSDSSFATNVVVAKGGAGGTGAANGVAGVGSTAGGVGDTVYAGGSGSDGTVAGGVCGNAGAGGGGAGSTGAGGDASGLTAGTGTANNGGDGGAGRTGSNGGNPGSTYGGGGGGACAESNTDRTGGSGAKGRVFITYFVTTAPTVTTNAASAISSSGATLNGTVSSNGATTTVTFDYGTTTGYGSSITATQSPLVAGASGTAVSADLTGLTCGTSYHFRVKGVNSAGTSNGSDGTFATSACPMACNPPSNIPAGVSVTCQCDNFARATLNPSTIFNSNWIVSTSDSTGILPSIVNSGYLRLTNNTGNNAKAATVPGIFPAAGNYISVEFQQYAYNGTGADGIAVTLSDYAVPAVPGAYGGSLGYAQETGIHDGFAGGWLGVALDEYGNYQNTNEGRLGGPGFTVQSVGARGSGSGQTGYRWLGGTGTLTPNIDNHTSTTPSRGFYYQVVVDARNDPTSTSIAVNRDTTGTGTSYASLISIPNVYTAATAQGFTQAPVPTNWQISFTGSTGGSTNIHEISGLRICAQTIVPTTGGSADGFNAIDEAYGTPPSVAVQNYLSGHIFTKLIGTPFKLDVAALSNSQIVTTYAAGGAKTVTVNLVDNSDSLTDSTKDCTLSCTNTCKGKSAVTGGTQSLSFLSGATDKGQKISPSFTLNTAYQKLVAIISDGTTTACSTDSFAVRPLVIASATSFDVPAGAKNGATNTGSSGSPIFKAGSDNFVLSAYTTGVANSPSGYYGTMKVNSATIISTATYAGVVTGAFPAATPTTPATIAAAASTATGKTFTYSEVGGFQLPGYVPDVSCIVGGTSFTAAQCNLKPRGVYDGVATTDDCTTPGLTTAQCDALRALTWTGVDSISTKGDCVLDSYSNTKDANGKYGCNFGLTGTTAVFGRFIPDHFMVTSTMIVNRAEYAVTGSITAGSGALTLAAAAGVKVGDAISIAGAGAAGGTLFATVASVSANGLTVTLATNAATTVTNATVNVSAFSYMGEPMSALFTLTAQSAGFSTTKNYAGSTWAKLDPTAVGALNLGAIDNPVAPGVRVPLTSRISAAAATAGSFLSTCTPSPACLGVANVVVPFTFTRGANGDGPYGAMDVGIAPVDSDGVTTIYNLDTVNVVAATNDHTTIGRTAERYGRIKVANAYGSQLLPLSLSATVQYYTPTAWLNSITDNLTDMTLAATYPLLDKNGAATGSSTAASRSPASGLLSGQLTISLAKPTGGANVTGIATISPTNNPAAASTYLPVTAGTATFGVYKGNNNYIYRRESY